MKQYEIWWALLELPAGPRPVLLMSRNVAYRVLSRVLVCEVTRRARGIRTEVALGVRAGLRSPSVANLDNLLAVEPARLRRRIGRLPPEHEPYVKEALGFALEWRELARR